MTPEEIRDISIDSATAYYDYLERNGKGLQEIDVFELAYLDSRDLLIKLRLSAKLFDTETLFFKNLRNGIEYDTAQIRIIEYDNDRNILLIRPSVELVDVFKNLRSSDIKVISDLKFLVQRVKVWYELNGAKIAIPENESSLKNRISQIQFFPEERLQPSVGQKESLANIFTNPLSYVWGAPGTGKTQFVLAYGVLHYLNNKKKVAILAPTNNSIEQVLQGVIRMTDIAGVERKRIIRLGTPSRTFAEEFPEVCEEKGTQKKLDEIDRQIAILERVISYDNAVEEMNNKERNLSRFDDLIEANRNRIKALSDLETHIRQKKKKEIDIKYKAEEIQKLKTDIYSLERRKNSIGYKIFKLFSSSVNSIDNQIDKIQIKIVEASKERDFYTYEQREIDTTVRIKQKIADQKSSEVQIILSRLKGLFQGGTDFDEQISDLSESNLIKVKQKIVDELKSERDAREIDSHIIQEYKSTNRNKIQSDLTEYIKLRNKLALSSTKERLKDVQVVACTLDGYIGRYAESKLNVEHIFLDEAGYANIIKTLTLFNHRVPITLLGDHMQLPPVCEINDSEIRRSDEYRNVFLWSQSAVHLDHLFINNRDTCLNQYLKNIPFKPISIKRTSLNETYRFGNNLAQILAQHVYDENFTSINSMGETEILYVHATKIESPYSRVSTNEVEAIRKIVENLKRMNQNDFVILSPYRKQIKHLNQYLPQERNELKILTVHGSQGREWETVILSVVDTSDKFFVDSTLAVSRGLNLVNTAISRAKRRLIIVCDKEYWIRQRGQLITDLIKNGKEVTI